VFTVHADGDSLPIVLLTKRSVLGGGKVQAFRLSDTVFIEVEES
jgi:hypothetical protein